MSALEEQNAALRQELAEQWWANHDEHCSGEWPHRESKACYWPLPELLTEDDVPRDWRTGPWPPNPLLEMFTPLTPEEAARVVIVCALCDTRLPSGPEPFEHDCATGYVSILEARQP